MSLLTKIRVRYCETDANGHVNNVSYFIYIEQARVDLLKDLQLTLSNDNYGMAVVSVSCDFISPAFFDQELEISTSVDKIGRKSVTLIHDILDAFSKKKIAQGKSVAIILDIKENKSISLTEEWIQKLKKHQITT